MASYPTSVKSFTSKTAGQNIDPTHINDIQDEVNALEAGLLNGTARLNAAGSTLTSLSVTGASTLGTLQGGASTVTSLQVTGASSFATRPVFTPTDVALVYLDVVYDTGSSGFSTLSYVAESILTNSSMHSTGLNPSRLVPQSTGVYVITAQINAGIPTAGNYMRLTIRDSSAAIIGSVNSDTGTGAGVTRRLQASGYKRFDALGGYAICEVEGQAASTMSCSSGVGLSWFSMVKL